MSHTVEVTVNGGFNYIMGDAFYLNITKGITSYANIESSIRSKLAPEIILGYFDAEKPETFITICDSSSLNDAIDRCLPNEALKIVVRFKDTLQSKENQSLRQEFEMLKREKGERAIAVTERRGQNVDENVPDVAIWTGKTETN